MNPWLIVNQMMNFQNLDSMQIVNQVQIPHKYPMAAFHRMIFVLIILEWMLDHLNPLSWLLTMMSKLPVKNSKGGIH